MAVGTASRPRESLLIHRTQSWLEASFKHKSNSVFSRYKFSARNSAKKVANILLQN